jgi:hypothetical protein
LKSSPLVLRFQVSGPAGAAGVAVDAGADGSTTPADGLGVGVTLVGGEAVATDAVGAGADGSNSPTDWLGVTVGGGEAVAEGAVDAGTDDSTTSDRLAFGATVGVGDGSAPPTHETASTIAARTRSADTGSVE